MVDESAARLMLRIPLPLAAAPVVDEARAA